VQQATPGRIVLATIDPDRNGGQDHAPALITAVADDGTATVLIFHADTTTHAAAGIVLHADRATVDELDEKERPSCAAYWPTIAPAAEPEPVEPEPVVEPVAEAKPAKKAPGSDAPAAV
jgi:hypothetical protein